MWTAVITRVGTPCFSSASCIARQLMIVASIPIESAVTRSISRAADEIPRKKLPPPSTIPNCTPVRNTSATSSASSFTCAPSMPKLAPPARTSPLSFNSTRLYFGWLIATPPKIEKGRP